MASMLDQVCFRRSGLQYCSEVCTTASLLSPETLSETSRPGRAQECACLGMSSIALRSIATAYGVVPWAVSGCLSACSQRRLAVDCWVRMPRACWSGTVANAFEADSAAGSLLVSSKCDGCRYAVLAQDIPTQARTSLRLWPMGPCIGSGAVLHDWRPRYGLT